MKIWNTKNVNYVAATERVEYDLLGWHVSSEPFFLFNNQKDAQSLRTNSIPPKLISNVDLTFRIGEAIYNDLLAASKQRKTNRNIIFFKNKA